MKFLIFLMWEILSIHKVIKGTQDNVWDVKYKYKFIGVHLCCILGQRKKVSAIEALICPQWIDRQGVYLWKCYRINELLNCLKGSYASLRLMCYCKFYQFMVGLGRKDVFWGIPLEMKSFCWGFLSADFFNVFGIKFL